MKPILVPLIKGSRELSSLTDLEREALARWAGKTAIIASHAGGAGLPINPRPLTWMRLNEQAPPGRFAVVVCRFDHPHIGYREANWNWPLVGGGRTGMGTLMALALPKLAFVCAFPSPELKYQCYADLSVLLPLWPQSRAWLQLDNPPPAIENGDFNSAIGDVLQRIEIKQSAAD